MRPRFLRFFLTMGLFLGTTMVTSPAFAQDGASIASELERLADTTAEEKQMYAAEANKEIATIEQAMTRLLEEAQTEGNVAAVECIQPRLTSIRALQNVSVSSERNMQTALAAKADARANHEFRKIAVAVHKARTLWAQAQRCVDYDSDQDSYVQVDWESFLNEVAGNSINGDLIPAAGVGNEGVPPGVSPFN